MRCHDCLGQIQGQVVCIKSGFEILNSIDARFLAIIVLSGGSIWKIRGAKKLFACVKPSAWVFIFLIPFLLALRLLLDLNGLLDNNTSRLSVTRQYIYYAAVVIKCGVYMYGLVMLRRLFSLFEKVGVIFYSKDNVICYKSIGVAFISIGLLNIETLIRMGLIFDDPGAQIILSLSFLVVFLPGLLPGLVLLLISWVMDEGRKIAEEQQQFL